MSRKVLITFTSTVYQRSSITVDEDEVRDAIDEYGFLEEDKLNDDLRHRVFDKVEAIDEEDVEWRANYLN